MTEADIVADPAGGWREPWPRVFEEHPLVTAQAPTDTLRLAQRTIEDLRGRWP